jgi:hypothetical protein
MPRPRIHKCTTHLIKFCPEIKIIVDRERKKIGANKASINYSMVVNSIIESWENLNSKK